jgi:hypothetical protein
MIIVNLKGGLGNQMFQYALGYILAKKKNVIYFAILDFKNFIKKIPLQEMFHEKLI